MNPCEGYACPPTHSIPSGDVIVTHITHLANTGMDTTTMGGWIVTGLLFVAGGVLFWYNHAMKKEKDEEPRS